MNDIEFYTMFLPGPYFLTKVADRDAFQEELVKTKSYKYRWIGRLAAWWWEMGTPWPSTCRNVAMGVRIYYCKELKE